MTLATPQLILHIGSPKTGTTAIQQALTRAHDDLLRAHGVLYPHVGRGERTLERHTGVTAAAIAGGVSAETCFHSLMNEFQGCGANCMVLSDEGMALKPEAAPFFARFAERGFEITVLCYLRRWDHFIESAYNQVSRLHGFSGVPPIDEFAVDPRVQRKADFVAMLAPWAAVSEKMVVRDFQQAAATGLLVDVARVLGLGDSTALPSDASSNVSNDVRVVALLHWLSRGNAARALKQSLQTLDATVAQLVAQGALPARKGMLGSRLREQVLAHAKPQAALLAERYGMTFSSAMPTHEAMEPLRVPDGEFLLTLMGALPPEGARMLLEMMQKAFSARGGAVTHLSPSAKTGASDSQAQTPGGLSEHQQYLQQRRERKRLAGGAGGVKKKRRLQP